MSWPEGVPTRRVTIGKAYSIERGENLGVRLHVRSDTGSLVWAATGERLVRIAATADGGQGSPASLVLPCTDATGWKYESGFDVDVSAEGSFTHRYLAEVSALDTGRRIIEGSTVKFAFVLPQGDDPIDLGLAFESGTIAGDALRVPIEWAENFAGTTDAMERAEAAAAAAEAVAAQPDGIRDNAVRAEAAAVDAGASAAIATAAQEAAETAALSVGNIDDADAVPLPNGADATVEIDGPLGARVIHLGIPEGPPGPNTIPTDEAVAGMVSPTSASATDAALYDRFSRFSLATAKLRYGMHFAINPPVTSVHQSVFVIDALDGEVWYTRTLTGDGSVDDYAIYRGSPSGVVYETLTVKNGGHGNSVFVEVDGGGAIWLWSFFYLEGVTPPGRYKWARFPWRTGTVTWEDVSSYEVPVMSGVYGTAHFDEGTGLIGWRTNDPEEYRLRVLRIEDVKAGVYDPISDTSIPQSLLDGFQNCTYFDGRWYFLTGHASTSAPDQIAYIFEIDADTGTVIYQRNVNQLRLGYQPATPGNYSEMEGLAVVRDAHGKPTLIIGHVVGKVSERQNIISTMTMDGTSPIPYAPFTHNDLVSRWASVGGSSFSTGWTPNAARPVQCRRMGDYLEFIGDALASPLATPGSRYTVLSIGVERAPAATRYATAAVGSQDGEQIASARVSLTTGGNLQAYFPAGTGPIGTALHLDGVRFYVGDMP